MARYAIINYDGSGGLLTITNQICDNVIGAGKLAVADIIGKLLGGQGDHEF